MKTKSLAAIAIALTLGMASTSCSKNNDEPSPASEYKFSNEIAFSEDMVNVIDITLEFTDIQGKTTTKNIKDCPKEERSYPNGKGETVTVNCYVFKNVETTKVKPSQTTLNIKYTPLVTDPGQFTAFIKPNFYVGIPAGGDKWTKFQKKDTAHALGKITLDSEKFASYVERISKSYGKYVMSVDKDGEFFIE